MKLTTIYGRYAHTFHLKVWCLPMFLVVSLDFVSGYPRTRKGSRSASFDSQQSLESHTLKEASQDKDWCFAKKGVTFLNFSREVSSSMILAIILTPIGSIYNILACIWLTFILDVGKKLDNIQSYMDPESYGTGMFPPHRSNVFAVGLRWIWWRFLKICQRVNICAST